MDYNQHFNGLWYKRWRENVFVTLQFDDGTYYGKLPWDDTLEFAFTFAESPDWRAFVKFVKVVNEAEEDLWENEINVQVTAGTTLKFKMDKMAPRMSPKHMVDLRNEYFRLIKRRWRSIDAPWSSE